MRQTEISAKNLLGSQPSSVLRDAAEEVISILKDRNLRDPERHERISRSLTGKAAAQQAHEGGMSLARYSTLVQLAKELDDFEMDSNTQNRQQSDVANGSRERVDDEMGVAVVFNDSDEDSNGKDDDESGTEDGMVVDISSDSEDEDSVEEKMDADLPDANDEKIVQGVNKDALARKATRVLSVHEIDAHFLQRLITKSEDDAEDSARLANEVLMVLDVRTTYDIRECETKLLLLLNFDRFELVKLLLHNRVRVWACVSIKRAKTDLERLEIEKILAEEVSGEGKLVLDEINSKSGAKLWSKERVQDLAGSFEGKRESDDVSKALDSAPKLGHSGLRPDKEGTVNNEGGVKALDLQKLAFEDGMKTAGAKNCQLPETSWRAMKKGYEEVHVPAVRNVASSSEELVKISDLPHWAQHAFDGFETLNTVQSRLYETALKTSENVLLCAPTGAGKTNVACLTMLNILGQFRTTQEVQHQDKGLPLDDSYALDAFKIVYISPMKALVQEQVKNFSKRLGAYGVSVQELSGDSNLSRHQIADTQILVTTPEKWDIITRQGEGRSYTQLVKLVIIDEIHLLADDRGPVLESIVARILRQVQATGEPVRLVGLSATLPNYADVAAFLRVKPEKGLFFFDHSYRPVPLQMQYAGITERNAFKRLQLQNQICYEKALGQRKSGNQILIFVHSRMETAKTARALRDLAQERDELSSFVREGSRVQELLREESASAKSKDLKDLLLYGFAIHHAGLGREDRELVEDLFADRHIGVLCTTATLAWGVNLPAHAVVIKGTQIYDPAKSKWSELSPLDILQMLGRAGRPQYDSEGEGLIITQHSELQYYLSLTNLQLPVESQLIKTLADHLNAEVVLGTVQTIEEAAEWLSYTFLFVRMLQNPQLYGVEEGSLEQDPTLLRHRINLVHSAAAILEKSHLVRYDRKSGNINPTSLGRVSSQFYVSHSSIAIYIRHMRPNLTEIDLLRLFAMSGEFRQISVREEEKLELAKMAAKVPIPVKENHTEPLAKVNILFQAYVSRLKLDGFALVSDMAFIQQSAGRLMRCLFEIALRRKWSRIARMILSLSKMVSSRLWRSQSPIRQFRDVPDIVARRLERKTDIDFVRYLDLTSSDLGELVGVPKMGRVLHRLLQRFPKIDIVATQVQPITRSILRIELTLVSAFLMDFNIHGPLQLFHLFVEDVNGDTILYHDYFRLRSNEGDKEHVLTFSVPVLGVLPPAFFVRLVSDRWLHSETVTAVSLQNIILPTKFPPVTDLLDLQPLTPSTMNDTVSSKVFDFDEFNSIQTQTFHQLFKTDENCLICAPPGSGKTVCAEFSMVRTLVNGPDGKCLYVAPNNDILQPIFDRWIQKFGPIIGVSSIAVLVGDVSADLRLIQSSRIILCTARNLDMLTRRWKQRRAIHSLSLVIFDELHFLGGDIGPTLEVLLARMRYMNVFRQEKGHPSLRIVGLGAPMANARDVGEWMGAGQKSTFNFSPMSRPFPVEVFFQSFEQSSVPSRLAAMSKPLYNTLLHHLDDESAMIFVPSRRQAQLTAIDIMTYCNGKDDPLYTVLTSALDESLLDSIQEQALKQVMCSGVGYLHEGMVQSDWRAVIEAYSTGRIKVLAIPVNLCWKVQCTAHLIVVMGTESFNGREGSFIDYKSVDLLHMMGRHRYGEKGKCVVMCHQLKKDILKRFLYEALPVESHLDRYLHDHIISEAVARTVQTLQDTVDYMTWTFLYRRLSKNPSYYGLRDTSNILISEFLSEMVENVIGDLEESNCLKVNETGEITALNLGMIAAYYGIQYKTVDIMSSSLKAKTKLRGLLEIIAAAWEMESIPLRQNEEKVIKILSRDINGTTQDMGYDSHMKALVLLQCHFSRKVLPPDLRSDQQLVLKKALSLIPALVDIISSNGWLKPALAVMEISQMIVQGLWQKDHALKQIPHFTEDIVRRCVDYNQADPVESVFDILALDDDVRNELLRLPDEKMADVAMFCNNYPSVEVSVDINNANELVAGEAIVMNIELMRDVEDEDLSEDSIRELGTVVAPLLQQERKESYWVVVGDVSTNTIFALKRVALARSQALKLSFLAPKEAGDYNLTVFCMSDSYMGCDQEYVHAISVGANSSDEDDDGGYSSSDS